METRKYYSTRFLIDIESASQDDCCLVWVVPIGIARIMQGLLSERGLWRSTYVKTYHKDYYVLPEWGEWGVLEDKIRAWLGGVDMSGQCLEELANAIKYLADKQFNKPCCDGGGAVAQGITDDGRPIYGSKEPITIPDEGQGSPPEGFDTWGDYYTHKCQVANIITDGLSDSLRNLSFISFVGGVAGTGVVLAAIAGFITVPVALIPMLIAALIGNVLIQQTVGALGDYMQTNRQEVVCLLYNSSSAQVAIDKLIEWVDEALGALAVASTLHPAIRTIALLLASTDTINQLFDVTIQLEYPDADCTSCGEGCEPVFNDFSQTTGNFYGIRSAAEDGTFTHQNERLEAQRTTGFQGGRYVGWRVDVNRVCVAGDYIHVKAQRLNQVNPFAMYVQVNFDDATNAYLANYGTSTEVYDWNLSLQDYIGKNITNAQVYMEGQSPDQAMWDDIEYQFCGEPIS